MKKQRTTWSKQVDFVLYLLLVFLFSFYIGLMIKGFEELAVGWIILLGFLIRHWTRSR